MLLKKFADQKKLVGTDEMSRVRIVLLRVATSHQFPISLLDDQLVIHRLDFMQPEHALCCMVDRKDDGALFDEPLQFYLYDNGIASYNRYVTDVWSVSDPIEDLVEYLQHKVCRFKRIDGKTVQDNYVDGEKLANLLGAHYFIFQHCHIDNLATTTIWSDQASG